LTNNLSGKNYNLLHLILPIGISFYTFENLSYTIDVYRGEFEPVKKFSDYLLFLSFFPKLVMGPIVRAHDFIPQINKPYQITEEDFMKGFYLIITGLFKKLIISDYITLNFVDIVFDDPQMHTGLENLVAVYAYAVVIYCDFSGYSDIAIGIARWMGFNIPTNFLSPYQSSNITEFWRRWHISLSSWLKDYLYIPLGGNRSTSIFTFLFSSLFFCGILLGGHKLFHLNYFVSSIIACIVLLIFILPAIILKQRKQLGTNFNLLVTMLLGGFWHGANWNFIIWGALHGIALAVHKLWGLLTGKTNQKTKQRNIFKILHVFITLNFVCFCWIFFKAKSFEDAMSVIYQISNNFKLEVWPSFYSNYKTVIYMMGLGFLIHFIPDNLADKVISKHAKKIPFIIYIIVLFAFVYLYGFFKSSEQVMPIYLQF
jgi:D-alanyl-lipoteichoic acid acyltransferase DltB (MBOAT superfamily)